LPVPLHKQLLILSRRDAARIEVLNQNEVVCEFQPLISLTLGRGRTLATDCGSPVALLRDDRSRLKQMLLNLALNARDTMSPGGGLRISAWAGQHEADTPLGRQYRPGRYARLREARYRERDGYGDTGAHFRALHHDEERWRRRGLTIVHSIVV
jgi:signal transduction histidine kinase